MQQEIFKNIKTRLLKLPVLYLTQNRERFQMFSDTSNTAAGSALFQIQNGT